MLKKEVKVEAWTVTKEELNMTKIDGFLDLVFAHCFTVIRVYSKASPSLSTHNPV